MLTRANRLRRTTDFQRVYVRSRTAAGRRFVLKYRPGAAAQSRVGIVVGSKVSKRAVERNLLRRRIREAFREELRHLPSRLDLILIAKPTAKGAKFKEIQAEIATLIRQTGIRPTPSPAPRT